LGRSLIAKSFLLPTIPAVPALLNQRLRVDDDFCSATRTIMAAIYGSINHARKPGGPQ